MVKCIIRMLVPILAAISLSSCVVYDDGYLPAAGGGVDFRIGVSINTPSPVTTKAEVPGSSDENAVSSFEVFVFERDAEGKLAAYGEKSGFSYSDRWLSLNTKAGDYRICVVANFETIGTSVIRNYGDLCGLELGDEYLPEASDNDGGLTPQSPRVVMYGEEFVSLAPSDTPVQLTLGIDFVVSKLKVSLWNELPPGESFVIKSVTLHDTRSGSMLAGQDVDSGAGINPPLALYDDAAGMEPSVDDKFVSGVVYLFENRAGAVSSGGTDQKDKGAKALALVNYGKTPSYVLVSGVYTDPAGDRFNIDQRVYLGHDNHSDFNVKRSEYHDYTIRVTSKGTNDTRVRIDAIADMEFISQPVLQDAHYVIYPIKISVANTGGDGWILSSDQYWLMLENELGDWQEQGYWTEPQEPKTVISGQDGDEITVYALLLENTDQPDIMRTATLTLRENLQGAPVAATMQVDQLPVNWTSGGLGTERIEEYGVPGQGDGYKFGFDWNRTVVYKKGVNIFESAWYHFVVLLYKLFGDDTVSASGLFTVTVKIDYSKRVGTSGAESKSDGHANTWKLYSDGAGKITQLENYLKREDFKLDSENGSWNDVEYYAAKVCMLKNKFRLKGAPNPEGGIYYSPEISEAEVEWYLPARNGLSGIEDSDYPLADGSAYWSSTAISGEPPRSWSYTPGAGTYAVSDRGSLHRVRCVRRPR